MLVVVTISFNSISTKSNVIDARTLEVFMISRTRPKLYCSPVSALRFKLPEDLD